MNKHEKFLEFNGKTLIFLSVDGTYWIPLKPILEAFNLVADSYLKRTKRDHFFSTCLDNVSVQVDKNGRSQARSMTCLPEEFIYGWICSINSNNKELTEYKRTCYRLLYNHFHGVITNRKELLIEKNEINTEIGKLEMELKEDNEKYQKLKTLKNKRKAVNTKLTSFDKELIKQPELFKD